MFYLLMSCTMAFLIFTGDLIVGKAGVPSAIVCESTLMQAGRLLYPLYYLLRNISYLLLFQDYRWRGSLISMEKNIKIITLDPPCTLTISNQIDLIFIWDVFWIKSLVSLFDGCRNSAHQRKRPCRINRYGLFMIFF